MNITSWTLETHKDYNLKYSHTLVMMNYALEQAVVAQLKQDELKKGIHR